MRSSSFTIENFSIGLGFL
jgi:Protein of unknown function (DUF3433)